MSAANICGPRAGQAPHARGRPSCDGRVRACGPSTHACVDAAWSAAPKRAPPAVPGVCDAAGGTWARGAHPTCVNEARCRPREPGQRGCSPRRQHVGPRGRCTRVSMASRACADDVGTHARGTVSVLGCCARGCADVGAEACARVSVCAACMARHVQSAWRTEGVLEAVRACRAADGGHPAPCIDDLCACRCRGVVLCFVPRSGTPDHSYDCAQSRGAAEAARRRMECSPCRRPSDGPARRSDATRIAAAGKTVCVRARCDGCTDASETHRGSAGHAEEARAQSGAGPANAPPLIGHLDTRPSGPAPRCVCDCE